MSLIFTRHPPSRIGINKYFSSVERIYIEGAVTRTPPFVPRLRIIRFRRFRAPFRDSAKIARVASFRKRVIFECEDETTGRRGGGPERRDPSCGAEVCSPLINRLVAALIWRSRCIYLKSHRARFHSRPTSVTKASRKLQRALLIYSSLERAALAFGSLAAFVFPD